MKHVKIKPNRQHARDIMAMFKVLLVVVQIAVFVIGWELMQERIRFWAQTSVLLFVIYALVLTWMHNTYESLRVGSVKVMNLITGQLLTLLVSDGMLFLLCVLAIRRLPVLWMFAVVFAVQLVLSIVWCQTANLLFSRITPAKRTAVIFDTEYGREAIAGVFDSTAKYDVCKYLCIRDFAPPYDDLLREIDDIESIFMTEAPEEVRAAVFSYAAERDLSVSLYPTLNDVMLSTARRRYIGNVPTMKVGIGFAPLPVRAIKRAMDIAISGLLLVVTAPVMAVVALLVWQEDRGPALYKQKRLTLHGKEFEILKFRSMQVDAEKDGVARLATRQDDRITRVGRVIRATRLDELPQLWNIFVGDMSLVGPRPERPEIAAQYMKELPQFSARLQVKAGLTGYAQVNGKYNTTPEDKLKMDLMYISDISIPLDVKLILQTIQIMLKKESAEGIAQGGITAMKK